MVAAVNLLRVGRPADRALAWISLSGAVSWLLVALAFGRIVGSVLDFRALTHVVVADVLAAFPVQTARRARG